MLKVTQRLTDVLVAYRLKSLSAMLRLGGRMCGFSALLSVLLAAAAAEAASSDLFDNQLGDISYCKKQCQLTIKNRSPAKWQVPHAVSGLFFCMQPPGCYSSRSGPRKMDAASFLLHLKDSSKNVHRSLLVTPGHTAPEQGGRSAITLHFYVQRFDFQWRMFCFPTASSSSSSSSSSICVFRCGSTHPAGQQEQSCTTTSSGSSYRKHDSIMNACYRGCRLYSICQFVNGNAGFNTSREECQGACQEAYIKLLEQEACSTGCASQPSEPEIKRRKLKAMTLRPKPPSVMEAVSSWCNEIVSSAQSFISSTWTFYLQADDGKVVVFQVSTDFVLD
ncbi:unnamed protein product [Pleuronectes platessa]|uniref:Transmembrane protein 59 n=1 Tax=Pleuronectes platessa TaxID=8262 RepID=A0A9N7VQV7_PLEPL|nr:unnamed protein product [Pleuronectes platessa]